MYRIFIILLIFASLPIQFLIGIIILISEGWPVFYTQKRVGKDGENFNLIKFRTMVTNADELKVTLKLKNQANGPVFKIHNDPRFTKIGKFLSHTGLDELPQFINILKGDMSLVGPRPLPLSEAKQLTPWQKKRHIVKPGIISPWIVDGYHSTRFDDWMKSDIVYSQEKDIKTDLLLFVKSALFVLGQIVREFKDLIIT